MTLHTALCCSWLPSGRGSLPILSVQYIKLRKVVFDPEVPLLQRFYADDVADLYLPLSEFFIVEGKCLH